MSVALPGPALFVTQYYRPELIGSAPFCADVAEWLRRNGVPVEVLTSRPHYPANEVFEGYRAGERDSEVLNEVPVRRLPTRAPAGGGALQRAASAGYFLAQGLSHLARGSFGRHDLVVSLSPSIFAVVLAICSRARGGRHIVLVHDIESGLARGLGIAGGGVFTKTLRGIERAALNRADMIVVLSEEMKRQLEALQVTTPIRTLPIWIDTKAVHPLPVAADRPLTLLYSGNFGRKQALHQVLDLAEVLKESDPGIRIVLRGGGREAETLAAQARERNLGNVSFEPLAPPERLNEALSDGDIHLVPQNPDGADFAVPSKIYGIMAAGRPFIATALPGSQLAHLRDEADAFLCVPPEDAQAFAGAVRQLAADRALRDRLGRNGRAHVEAHHTKANVLSEFMNAVTDCRESGHGG